MAQIAVTLKVTGTEVVGECLDASSEMITIRTIDGKVRRIPQDAWSSWEVLGSGPSGTPGHCDRCQQSRDTSKVQGFEDGHSEQWCVTCWNADVYRRRAERKAELAARPKCDHCHKKVGTWRVGAGTPVLLCGWCRKRALQLGNSRVSGNFAYLGMFGPPMTGAAVLEMLAAS